MSSPPNRRQSHPGVKASVPGLPQQDGEPQREEAAGQAQRPHHQQVDLHLAEDAEAVPEARVGEEPGQEVVLGRQEAVAAALRPPARHVAEDPPQVDGGKDGGRHADEDAEGGEDGAENLWDRDGGGGG